MENEDGRKSEETGCWNGLGCLFVCMGISLFILVYAWVTAGFPGL